MTSIAGTSQTREFLSRVAGMPLKLAERAFASTDIRTSEIFGGGVYFASRREDHQLQYFFIKNNSGEILLLNFPAVGDQWNLTLLAKDRTMQSFYGAGYIRAIARHVRALLRRENILACFKDLPLTIDSSGRNN